MKTTIPKFICVFSLLFFSAFSLKAQENVPKYQFGISGGTFVYQGDLTPDPLGSYRTLRPAISLFAGRIFSPSWSARLNFARGRLSGNDAAYSKPDYRQQRNFNYTSPVTELSLLAEWNPLGRNYRSRGLSPYVFGGIGYSFLNISRDWSNLNESYFAPESGVLTGLPEDISTSPPGGLLVMPVGIGARYYLNDRIGISAETSYRIFTTDYLDGFSQAVNREKTDHYYSHMVGVVYRIGKKNTLECPVVKY